MEIKSIPMHFWFPSHENNEKIVAAILENGGMVVSKVENWTLQVKLHDENLDVDSYYQGQVVCEDFIWDTIKVGQL